MIDEIITLGLLGIMVLAGAPIVMWMITYVIIILHEYLDLKR